MSQYYNVTPPSCLLSTVRTSERELQVGAGSPLSQPGIQLIAGAPGPTFKLKAEHAPRSLESFFIRSPVLCQICCFLLSPQMPSNCKCYCLHRSPADLFFLARLPLCVSSLAHTDLLITPHVQLFGVLWNWTLYGVLIVQLCKLIICSLQSSHTSSANHTAKMCIATTSRKTRNSSNYQACIFFTDYAVHLSDSFSTVYAIFFIETLQTALSGADLYYWFGSGFGNIHHLSNPYASAFDVPIMGSIVSGAVQYFFVYRIWVLSDRKWWLCVIISVVSRL